MSTPLVGHLDPEFLEIMNESMDMLRRLFQTNNTLTIPISRNRQHAGMEAAFCNVIEDGNEVLICVNGVFGRRMTDVAERCRAKLTLIEADWGKIIPSEKVKIELDKKKLKLLPSSMLKRQQVHCNR